MAFLSHDSLMLVFTLSLALSMPRVLTIAWQAMGFVFKALKIRRDLYATAQFNLCVFLSCCEIDWK